MRTFARPIVNAAWLRERLADGAARNVRVLDCTVMLDRSDANVLPYTVRSGRDGFLSKRIPGAHYLDLQATSLKGTDATGTDSYGNQINFQFDQEAFFKVLRGLGVHNETHVVLYTHTAPMWATRVFWMLYSAGYAGDMSVLDGGLGAWEAAGFPTDSGEVDEAEETDCGEVLSPNPELKPPHAVFTTKADVMQQHVVDQCGALVNALPSVPMFEGRDAQYGRAGRIPESIHLPFTAFLNPDKTFKAKADVAAAFAAAGLSAQPEAFTAYCGGGISATVPLFLALTVLQWECPLQLFDGSLQEWCGDASLPLECGAPRGVTQCVQSLG